MTIYEGLGGSIAYTIEGNTVYRGLSNDVAFTISGSTIYEGKGGNVAFKIDGKTIYRGLGNTIAYKIDGNYIYEGLGGNIAYKIDSSSSRRTAASARSESSNYSSYSGSSSSVYGGYSASSSSSSSSSDWPNHFGEGSEVMNEIEKFQRMSRGEIDILGNPLPQRPYIPQQRVQPIKPAKPSASPKDFDGYWTSSDGKIALCFMKDGTYMLGKGSIFGTYEISEDVLHLYPGEQRHFTISFTYVFSGNSVTLTNVDRDEVNSLRRVNLTDGIDKTIAKLELGINYCKGENVDKDIAKGLYVIEKALDTLGDNVSFGHCFELGPLLAGISDSNGDKVQKYQRLSAKFLQIALANSDGMALLEANMGPQVVMVLKGLLNSVNGWLSAYDGDSQNSGQQASPPSTTSNNCSNCGNSFSSQTAQFCGHCGTKRMA